MPFGIATVPQNIYAFWHCYSAAIYSCVVTVPLYIDHTATVLVEYTSEPYCHSATKGYAKKMAAL